MLALATHETHFTILREQVVTGRLRDQPPRCHYCSKSTHHNQECPHRHGEIKNAQAAASRKPFQLLRISCLREYLRIEFGPERFVKGEVQWSTLPFAYDFEVPAVPSDHPTAAPSPSQSVTPPPPAARGGRFRVLLHVRGQRLPPAPALAPHPGSVGGVGRCCWSVLLVGGVGRRCRSVGWHVCWFFTSMSWVRPLPCAAPSSYMVPVVCVSVVCCLVSGVWCLVSGARCAVLPGVRCLGACRRGRSTC